MNRLGQSLSEDEEATTEDQADTDSSADADSSPEYSFEGFEVAISEKIALLAIDGPKK